MTEKFFPLKAVRKSPQRRAFAESGAIAAVFRYDSSRENAFGALRRARQTRNKNSIPLIMARAQRKPFKIVLPAGEPTFHFFTLCTNFSAKFVQ